VIFAFTLMAFGAYEILAGALVSGLWLVLIGLFLQNAANASSAQIGLREALARLPVSQIMARDVVSVAPEDTVASLVDRFWEHNVASFAVVEGDRVIGIASIGSLQQVPREEWPFLRVREIMRPLDETLTVGPTDSAHRALERASSNGLGRLAVMEGERLVGYLSTQDITHVLALHRLGQNALRRDRRFERPPNLRRAACSADSAFQQIGDVRDDRVAAEQQRGLDHQRRLVVEHVLPPLFR